MTKEARQVDQTDHRRAKKRCATLVCGCGGGVGQMEHGDIESVEDGSNGVILLCVA